MGETLNYVLRDPNDAADELDRCRRNIEELAMASERLLHTKPDERQEPKIWFGRVDALKLAIKVARGEIPHGRDFDTGEKKDAENG